MKKRDGDEGKRQQGKRLREREKIRKVEKEIDEHTNTDTHRLKERERKTELQMNKRDGEESVCG